MNKNKARTLPRLYGDPIHTIVRNLDRQLRLRIARRGKVSLKKA